MKEQELYEVQHRDGKCVPHYTFPFLRKVFRRFDLHREDLVLSLVDGGERLLDIGCGSGSLVFRAKPRFQETSGVDISSFCVGGGRKEGRKVREHPAHPILPSKCRGWARIPRWLLRYGDRRRCHGACLRPVFRDRGIPEGSFTLHRDPTTYFVTIFIFLLEHPSG